MRRADGAPLVAWQPLAGAAAAFVRRHGQPRLIVLNPLLTGRGGSAQRFALAGWRRAERILFFSRRGVETARALGLDPQRLEFVPLGVRARRDVSPPPGERFVAAGRENRDWPTLAAAANEVGIEVLAVGAREPLPGLRIVPQLDRAGLLALFEQSLAVVVPLAGADRPAGQLTVLDAMSVGRAVVATRAGGTEDYVGPETGVLVPAGDVPSLAAALERMRTTDAAAAMGAAALEAARGQFSLERFVREVDARARALD